MCESNMYILHVNNLWYVRQAYAVNFDQNILLNKNNKNRELLVFYNILTQRQVVLNQHFINEQFYTYLAAKMLMIINLIFVTFKNRNRDRKSRLSPVGMEIFVQTQTCRLIVRRQPSFFSKVLNIGCIKECNHPLGNALHQRKSNGR